MRFSLLVFISTVLLMSGASYATQENGNNPSGSFSGKAKAGVFCEIKKMEVCVIARDETDCTKIGGQKVESCSKKK
jgi:hypothetical protein